jgi:diadenosine tetraphosphate (Ap4A) HIT family hydrolase
MADFQIHPQLLADCHRLGKFPLCHVLLHKNGVVPWFILVPQTDARDFLDLTEPTRGAVLSEAATLTHFLKTTLDWPKVNFAAIGNIVEQLHLHVVGRKPSDPCWPAPVWGNLTVSRDYSVPELRDIVSQLARRCGLEVSQDGRGRLSR